MITVSLKLMGFAIPINGNYPLQRNLLNKLAFTQFYSPLRYQLPIDN
mgnify:FL=1